ncbi:hypothetical protein [Streptomyces collinus]|uniref:Secreted protein n=1 Tax=Streptomyces collinus (strain DSM 40733 / Tue 365) TaxID=1214242 RepID=S5UTE9_STRC3|nr:hypothetical protein [Streptomyces collinus]AGS69131.1 hypothetical protein B446_11545 [Streptomyces collinus Tu 365]UJA07769.1 hypothetical protein HGI10_16700 [Streptomyces collinus]UJA17365.1 hypothetical protein HGI09_47400 [Streptomyces collinus]
MNAHRAKRLAALSAVGVLMAGGAAIGTAGAASAATPSQVHTGGGCYYNDWWGGNCFNRNDFFRNNFNGFNNGFSSVPVVVVVVS